MTTDAMNQTETKTHDANGLLLTRTDRNLTTFHMTYDNMGRLTRIEAGNEFREYTFTPTGSLRSQTNGTHTITY